MNEQLTRRKLIVSGLAAAAGVSGLAIARRLAARYALIPPDSGGIYGVGYCVGGKYILMLGGEHPQSEQTQIDEEDGKVSKGPYIKTGTIAHGTLIEKEDIEQLKVPVSFACVGKF